MEVEYKQLGKDDLELMNNLLDLFGKMFEDQGTYCRNRPDLQYIQELLTGDSFDSNSSTKNNKLVGGLTAYELKKFEQKRSEN